MTLETEQDMTIIYLYVDLNAQQAQLLQALLIYFVRLHVSLQVPLAGQAMKATGSYCLFVLETPMNGVIIIYGDMARQEPTGK